MVASPAGEGRAAVAMPRPLAYAVLFGAVGSLAWLSLAILGPTKVAPIWPANGVLLAVLLYEPVRRWPVALVVALLGIGAGAVLNGGSPTSSFALAACNLVEVSLSALILRRFGGTPDLARLRFVTIGGLAAVAGASVSAIGAGFVLDWLGRGAIVASAVIWTLANALGQMTAAPIVLAWRALEASSGLPRQNLAWGGAGLAILTVVVVAVFQQARYDMVYLILGPLLLAVFQLEIVGAAVGILITSIVAVAFTVRGYGPMWLMSGPPTERVILLQVFLLGVVAMNFPLAAVLADRRKTQAAARRSQARLQFLSDNSRDVVFEFDDKARILYASAAARQLGWEPEDLVGHVCFDFVHPDDEARARHAMAVEMDPSLADGQIISREWRLRTKSGDYVWVEGNPSVVRDAQGQPIRYTDSVRDITRRKALEEEVRRKAAETETAEAGRRAAEARARDNQDELARVSRVLSVGEFASTIAHELNQPIAAIVTNGDTALRWLAADPPILDEARAAVARSIRDANRAAAVVSRTRAMLAKGVPAFAEVDIGACVNDVLMFTDTALRRNGVTVRRRLASSIPPVWGDRVQLQQVLLNLVGNAMDAMVDRPGARTLGIQAGVNAAGEVEVAVEDTGGGLDPKVADRLFDSFFTTKENGVGLGLPISRSIVETHGGRLWAEPREGGGTVFHFTLRPAAARAA